MGLDMNLTVTRSFGSGSIWNQAHNGWKPETIEYGAYYWRKNAPLHNYIVNEFTQYGEDDCKPIHLSAEDCLMISAWLKTKDWSVEQEDQGGFFFGSTECWKEHKDNADTYAKEFRQISEWLQDEDDDGAYRSCYYQASW